MTSIRERRKHFKDPLGSNIWNLFKKSKTEIEDLILMQEGQIEDQYNHIKNYIHQCGMVQIVHANMSYQEYAQHADNLCEVIRQAVPILSKERL